MSESTAPAPGDVVVRDGLVLLVLDNVDTITTDDGATVDVCRVVYTAPDDSRVVAPRYGIVR